MYTEAYDKSDKSRPCPSFSILSLQFVQTMYNVFLKDFKTLTLSPSSKCVKLPISSMRVYSFLKTVMFLVDTGKAVSPPIKYNSSFMLCRFHRDIFCPHCLVYGVV